MINSMKKNLFLFLFWILSFSVTAQYTQLPNYEKKKPWFTSIYIIGIGTSDYEVSVSIAISGAYSFNSQTYLEFVNPLNGCTDKVYLKDTWRETGEYAMRFASMGYESLSLVFPPIPNGVNRIDLISDKLNVYGISIQPVERSIQNNEIQRIADSELEINQLVNNSNTPIAGYYEATGYSSTRLAVVQVEDFIYIVYVSENDNVGTWKCGEIKAVLRSTAVSNTFKADWYSMDKRMENAIVSFDEVSMSVDVNNNGSIQFIKMGRPKGNKENGIEQENVWTGSGFAISDGVAITNYHVVDEARTICIKGVMGDMNTGYTAELVATDKVNDIAILKITDGRFEGFNTIPYAVQQRMADVGEDVFVLGYPLTQALGNEIKLTNGIISSRTGYQGNISTYQMTAPVQPGNSGGPMFDIQGNVIGIVVAGVPGAENVGYAIKTSYLKILIESAGLNIQFPANNSISKLSLAEKVKRVKNFVFYIECSK